MTEDARPIAFVNYKALVEDKVPLSFECRMNYPWSPPGTSGTEPTNTSTWLLISAVPVVDDDGSVTTIWGCNTDIRHASVSWTLTFVRTLFVNDYTVIRNGLKR